MASGKNVFYSAIGPELTLYSVDVDNAALIKRDTVSTPANIQYAWPHPSKRYLYVVSSNGGPGSSGVAGDKHVASAFRIDPATGALTPHGEPVTLPSRPIHTSVDIAGEYLLIAYNDPSGLTVHRINADGTIGEPVDQPGSARHRQICRTRSSPRLTTSQVILVTRGNNAPADKPVNPGSIKIFSFKNGVLTDLAAIRPAMACISGRAISTFIRPSHGSTSRSRARTSSTSTGSIPRPGFRASRCSSRTR